MDATVVAQNQIGPLSGEGGTFHTYCQLFHQKNAANRYHYERREAGADGYELTELLKQKWLAEQRFDDYNQNVWRPQTNEEKDRRFWLWCLGRDASSGPPSMGLKPVSSPQPPPQPVPVAPEPEPAPVTPPVPPPSAEQTQAPPELSGNEVVIIVGGLGTTVNSELAAADGLNSAQKIVSDVDAAKNLLVGIGNFTGMSAAIDKIGDKLSGVINPIKNSLDFAKNHNDAMNLLNGDPRFDNISDHEKQIKATVMSFIKQKMNGYVSKVSAAGPADAIMTALGKIQSKDTKVTMTHNVGGSSISIDTDFEHWTSGHIVSSIVDDGVTSTDADVSGVIVQQWEDIKNANGVMAKTVHVAKGAVTTVYAGGAWVSGKVVNTTAWLGTKITGLFR